MTRTFLPLGFGCVLAAGAQQPVVVLDAARGGADSGARVADRIPEKQVTLDIAGRLASLLRARGFTVAMTREGDQDVTNDARATLANNSRAIACIVLHATGTGAGVHLYTAALRARPLAVGAPVLWDEAQAPFVDRSRALERDLQAALKHSRIDASSGETWMRPLDNMQCPAVALEISPQKDGTGAEDSTYQAQVSNALANTLLQWRGKMESLTPTDPQPAPPASAAKPAAAMPAPAIPAAASAAKPPAKATAIPGAPKPQVSAPTPDRVEP